MNNQASQSSIGPQTKVYNSSYKGKTYAVKYLGIVDGAMGILSRKMALQNTNDL
jgi:hypothetical protein